MKKNYLLKNYLDCSETYRSIIYNEICDIGIHFSDPIINKFIYSKKGCLPQYVFLFLNSHLIGYLFLIKDKYERYDEHSCLARHNADELTRDEALLLLEEGVKICTTYNAKYLKHCLTNEIKNIG